METLKLVLNTLLTPIVGVSETISTYSTSFRKEKSVEYFAKVQQTLPTDRQQSTDALRERAEVISDLWRLP